MTTDPVLEIFREEAREHLGAIEKAFLDLEGAEVGDRRRELIDQLFRHAHSLKGDAKVVGLQELKVAAQQLEDILDALRDDPESVDRSAIDRGLSQFDHVRGAFESWMAGDEYGPDAEPGAEVEVSLVRPVDPPAITEPRGTEPAERGVPAMADESFTVRVPSERLDRMLNLAGEIRISQRGAGAIAGRLVALHHSLSGLRKNLERQSAEESRQGLEAALDQLQRLGGELRKKRTREELLAESLEGDIREARLLPLVMLTDSLRRGVRDLALSLGKSIRYEADVGRILLDKAVIESLKDPLMHLVRNCADHGLETAAERRERGKSEEGVIRVTAVRDGPRVRIAISDDGRGVDFARVRDRLRRSGEIDDATVDALTDEGLGAHLFRAGFSTAARGEVSGRGVGLDVARDTVRRLNGTVELASTSPNGTTFVITVPVSISTARVLTVMSGGQYFGVPSAAVRQTGRVRPEDLRELEGSPMLPVGGRLIRWVHLGDLLGDQAPRRAPDGRPLPYLLLARQDRPVAVAVDELEDESEVLLKPLGFPLNGLPGVVGAATRPDGAVQLVLDLTAAEWARGSEPRRAVARAPAGARSAARILIVDDSPTTRAVLRNVFTAAGFSVFTATDGLDALEKLRSILADVVVSDVEMPRLNGFDLTRQIKAKFDLPVILVTGMENDSDRREGLEAGADAFVVKSTFQDQSLLEIVRQLV